MSIATDEARKESYRRCLEGCVAPAQFSFQDGYVAGRTADPTESQIKAMAKRIFIFINGPWQGKHYELSYVEGAAIADAAWETADKQRYEACAQFAFEAARKAVME